MRLLGISTDVWISSAALVEDGRIIAAAAEERFDRKKMSKAFPVKAIEFCLKRAGTPIEDVDHIAIAWNPALHINSASSRYMEPARWRGEYLYSVPGALLNKFSCPEVSHMEEILHFNGRKMSILFVNHHDAHSANGFLLSGFDEAAILSMDGRGENQTCMLAKGFGNKISRIKSVFMPHSLGLFYGAFTEYLGFRPDSDEWKVMALASYGKSNNPYYKKLRDIIQLRQNGGFEIDLSYFDYYLFDRQPAMYSKKLTGLLGKPRAKDDKISDAHIQIAAAIQQMFEETAAHMLRHLYKTAKCRDLALSGGCAMNSVFNGKAADLTDFRNVFVSSCPDDSGNAVGAALYAYKCIFGRRNRYAMKDNYWGPEFSNKEIKETLDKYKAKYVFRKDIAKVTARLISEGKLAGWFQGRMEFGQRALGNRSILADPRDIKSKELVNRAVKYRESFRPFAPSVLGEYTGDYFDIPKGAEVPFMEKVCMVRQGKRQKIPAVVHVDGTGRAQTVSRHTNPLFYDLIDEFRKITGVPVVLNTSFNLNGEPIVCSPTDAIRTFVSCGLDCLAMGNYLILKENHHD